MSEMIEIKRVSLDEAKQQGILKWGIWEKEVSEFPWYYEITEVSYILEGEIEVTPDDGEMVQIKPGDLVTFKAGLSCTWKVNKAVRKHYSF
ncbi:MAG: cupin domain-containing protein [Candidatus Margulisbacteria bacterium]|nr:cupin domain-containing protein [Candidatus Margulisiibacteriota bacterium]